MQRNQDKQLLDNRRYIQLLLKHQQQLFGFILAIHPNFADTEDIFQETACVMLQKFDKFEPTSNFLAWGCKIARYEVLKYRQRKSGNAVCLSEEAMQQLQLYYDEVVSGVDDRLKALEGCVGKLAANDQALLRMRYQDGCRINEIADKIGRPVPGMYKVMARIHNALRLCVQRTLRAWQMEAT